MDETMGESTRPSDNQDQALASAPVHEPDIKAQQLSGTIEGVTDHDKSIKAAQTPSSIATVLQRSTDKALHFLAHASNETLGACLVGLGASTYLVLGRVGLVIIGVAGGVVLHATWEGIRHDDRDGASKSAEQERKRETGIEVVKMLMDWRQSKASAEDDLQDAAKATLSNELDFSRFEPETAAALNILTSAVIKDYVTYWYEPTVPGEEQFPTLCRRTLTAFLLSVSNHLERKRPADAFLDFITNASSMIIVFLNELSAALNASPNSSAKDAVSTYLEMKPDSSLAHVLDTGNQDRKLKVIAEDILKAYVDTKAYNCPPVQIFLKEILAQVVLGYTITLCSAPDWINDWIVYGLEESETTKEVMNIVDAGVEGGKAADVRKTDAQIAIPAPAQTEGRSTESLSDAVDHKRHVSRAEEAMDEAMREARRLTEMMIEEDQRLARESQDQLAMNGSSEDNSDAVTSQGAPTPTSSQSDRDGQENEMATPGDQPPIASQFEDRPATPTTKQPFTSFDQLLPNTQFTALADSPQRSQKEPPVLTLLGASISIFDDSVPGERAAIKAKPTTDYLIQIEPSSAAFAGWMIARKYADFEILHEVLRRLSVITGVRFTEAHAELPKWKLHTRASLRQELERYLIDAVRFIQLAESEGMKRFLERDQGLTKSPGKGFGWPTPDAFGRLGGDMINVLAKAPKEVAGGGKVLFGGVAGLIGGKKNQSQASINRTNTTSVDEKSVSSSIDGRSSMALPPESRKSMALSDTINSNLNQTYSARDSQESLGVPFAADNEGSVPVLSERGTTPQTPISPKRPLNGHIRTPSHASHSSTARAEIPIDPVSGIQDTIDLPPPPSEMPDDYGIKHASSRHSVDTLDGSQNGLSKSQDSLEPPPKPPRPNSNTTKAQAKPKQPITEQETSVAIELMFAVITELYTLSSAWQFRRTLLAAAKTFLLRPGNPQLAAIRDLLQNDMLTSNLSDSGIASHILKIRYNALPTTEELEAWKRDYPEKTSEQKEELRVKARKLLVTKGMPAALTSVMGAAASGEALGKVFDCLQVPEVSRGLIFGIMLQALKVVTH